MFLRHFFSILARMINIWGQKGLSYRLLPPRGRIGLSSTDVFSPWHSSSKLGSDGLGYLLHRGEENQHAHCCQHAAVYLTDGRSDEPADDEQEAGNKGDVECTHWDNG